MKQYDLHIPEAKAEVKCCVDMLKREQLAAKNRSIFPWECKFSEPKIFDYSLIRNCFHISRLS
jgi:hypothetical protein